MKRWLAAVSILLISIFGLWSQTLALEDANWRHVLQYFQDTFRTAGENLQKFNAKLDAHNLEFDRELVKIEKSKGQMMLMYGGSFDPDDLRCILQGLTMFRSKVTSRFKWFSDTKHALEISADKITELRTELKSQISDPSAGGYQDALNQDLKGISDLEARLDLIRSKMQKSRDTYDSYISRLDEAVQKTRLRVATYWTIYYLKSRPGFFSEEFLKELKTGARNWMTEGNLWWRMVNGPEEAARIRLLLLKVCLSVLLLALAGSIAIRQLAPSFFPQTGLAGLLTFWFLLSLWASISWFGASATFAMSWLVMKTGEEIFSIIMIYAFALFHRRSKDVATVSSKAVYPLWAVNLLGIQFASLDLPYDISLIAWTVSLAVCAGYMYWKRQRPADMREQYLYTAATYLPCILIVVAAWGYQPLSSLILSTVLYGWLSICICAHLLRSLRGCIKRKRVRDEFLIGTLSIMGFPLIGITAAYINLRLFSLHLGGSEVLHRILSAELTWDTYRLNLKRLCLIILGFYVTRVLALLVESMALRAAHLDTGITEVIEKSSKYLFWGFFFLAVLSLLGFNLMSLAVVAGGLSVGIGFGLQQIANNFFSGLILLVGRSVQPGDTIQINETLGDVRKITIRNTVVQTRDNATLFVPNSELITNKLINWSHRDRRVRLTVAVGVAYGSDTEQVRDLLLHAAQSVPGVLNAPAPGVLFSNFGASTLDFQLRFWIGDVDQDLQMLSQVRYEIERLFRENGIEIAFPQSTLHIQSAPALEKFFANNLSSRRL
jgi:small-conductance mechanosensitive channel